jgi:hypothetical protein
MVVEKEIEELNNEYLEQIKPKIISKYPPFKIHINLFEDSIILYCFTNGFKLIGSQTFYQFFLFKIIILIIKISFYLLY